MNKTTFMAKPGQVERKWYVVDATDVPLGRLSAVVASVLRGKNKPTFTPHTDTGDFVIVINAEKVKLTGKKATDKIYYTHSMYPGGLKQISAGELRSKNAVRLIEKSVKMAQAQYAGTGRRKNAVARVRLVPGTGKITVNKKDVEEYIPHADLRLVINQPFAVTSTEGSYDVHVNVVGGGYAGQSGAIRHGIARALLQVDPDFRDSLKRAGLLTRDARMVERKKPGLKKARKASQFSKR